MIEIVWEFVVKEEARGRSVCYTKGAESRHGYQLLSQACGMPGFLYFTLFLFPLIMTTMYKTGIGEMWKKMGEMQYENGEKRVFMISMLVMLLLLAYAVFLPLKLGTVWFYAGIATYLAGLVLYLIAIVNIATTPLGRPFTKGIYRYSRHPMMFSTSVTFVGASIASASWILLLLSVVFIVLQTSEATAEERGCLKTFGDEYQEYLNRTPRWIGMPKSR